MAKAVLTSVRPEWVEKIAGGQKTVEVRRTRPKLEPPFKCYIYCTKDKKDSDRLWVLREQIRKEYDGLTAVCAHLRAQPDLHSVGNGYVVGEFTCDNIETYNYDYCPHPEIGMDYDCGDSWWEIADEDLKSACMTEKEFRYYAFGSVQCTAGTFPNWKSTIRRSRLVVSNHGTVNANTTTWVLRFRSVGRAMSAL